MEHQHEFNIQTLQNSINQLQKELNSNFIKEASIQFHIKKNTNQSIDAATQSEDLDIDEAKQLSQIYEKHSRTYYTKAQLQNTSNLAEDFQHHNLDTDNSKYHDQSGQNNTNSLNNYNSHFINSDFSKEFSYDEQNQLDDSLLKKRKSDLQEYEQMKKIYGSLSKQKNVCQQCISKMHKLSQMEILKNQYYKSFMILKHEVQQLKHNKDKQSQRNSLNLTDIVDHFNEEKSEKSSFSFQNIQNTLLTERFLIQVDEFSRLIDKLLLVDINLIQVSSGDCKQFEAFCKKIIKLKFHLLIPQDECIVADFYEETIKYDKKIQDLHEKYKKVIQKMVKGYKQKIKKMNSDFEEVNKRFMKVLEEKSELSKQLQKMMSRQDLSSPPSFRSIQNFQLQHKSSLGKSFCEDDKITMFEEKNIELENKVDRFYMKIKSLEKTIKKYEKNIKDLTQQITMIKKRPANQFYQFMERIINSQKSARKDNSQKSVKNEVVLQSNENQTIFPAHLSKHKTYSEGHSFQISQINQIIYQIFSYTSDDTDSQQNIFTPQTKEELIQMLNHIKKFNKNFDVWQKDKERQMLMFQKNFLRLIKFFIETYQISEERLLQEVDRIQNMQSLKDYIRKYYLMIIEEKERLQSRMSDFTFGKRSMSDTSQI